MDLRPGPDHKMLSVDQTDVSNMIVAISWSFNLHGKWCIWAFLRIRLQKKINPNKFEIECD